MEVRMVASFGFSGLLTKAEASELLVIFYESTWVAAYKLYKNSSNCEDLYTFCMYRTFY